MKSFDDLELDRDDSLGDWFRWYFHPRKFWVDQAAHAAVGFAAAVSVALTGEAAWWAFLIVGAGAGIPREVQQWPPRRMPVLGRAWFDPPLDVACFALGGLAAWFVPRVL